MGIPLHSAGIIVEVDGTTLEEHGILRDAFFVTRAR